jgi:hypothetical protein
VRDFWFYCFVCLHVEYATLLRKSCVNYSRKLFFDVWGTIQAKSNNLLPPANTQTNFRALKNASNHQQPHPIIETIVLVAFKSITIIMVYVSPADEHDIRGEDTSLQHLVHSNVYVDALHLSAMAFLSALCLLAIEDGEEQEELSDPVPRVIASTILRLQTPIAHIFEQLGPQYTRRAFRMNAESFFDLHSMLFPIIGSSFILSATSKKQRQNGARNRLVLSTTRLGAALRYFAGGSPYDLAVMFGISVQEVYTSVWKVMYAINTCPLLNIAFPSDHAEQRQIAKRFQDRSKANFSCCLVAICPMREVTSTGLQAKRIVWNNCEAILEGDAKSPSKLVLKH